MPAAVTAAATRRADAADDAWRYASHLLDRFLAEDSPSLGESDVIEAFDSVAPSSESSLTYAGTGGP